MRLHLRHPPGYPSERAYVYDVVLSEFLALPYTTSLKARGPLELTMEGDPAERVVEVADVLFATDPARWLTPDCLPRSPLERLPDGDTTLPLLYVAGPSGAPVVAQGRSGRLDVRLDVFGSVFMMLSRLEEAVCPDRDEHGRFPVTALLSYRERFLHRPLVDDYVSLLASVLRQTWPAIPLRSRNYAVRLSHDVDWPAPPRTSAPACVRAMAGDLLRRRDVTLMPTRLQALTAQWRQRPQDNPFNRFDFLMDTAESHGLRSAFYFMTGCSDCRYDPGYEISDPWIEALLARIHARGHEIGLHPSYGSLDAPGVLVREFDALRQTCDRLGIQQDRWGGRQHFLRWTNPGSWRAWELAGLDYDSSLGFSSDCGFRSGTSHEHPVFDVRARHALRLRERPLVAMEMALIDDGPAHDGRARRRFAELGASCAAAGGDFTILWHNSRLASRREQRLFRAVVGDAVRLGHGSAFSPGGPTG